MHITRDDINHLSHLELTASCMKALFVETNEIWYRIRVGSYDKKETAIAVAKSLSSNRREKAWVDYVRYER